MKGIEWNSLLVGGAKNKSMGVNRKKYGRGPAKNKNTFHSAPIRILNGIAVKILLSMILAIHGVIMTKK